MSPTAREIIEAMPNVLQPAEAGDLVADVQFKLTGQEPGAYFLHIEKGQCTFNEGVSANPRTTINCASEVWIAIISGTLDPFQAFMQGKLQMHGDMGIALRLQRIFKAN
jgi:putative sterol carrier protein